MTPAGRFAVTEYQRLNVELYDGDLPPLPIVIGMVPYGRCIGWTAYGSAATGLTPDPLPPEIFRGSDRMAGGTNVIRDVLAHEMLHARLFLEGRDAKHNSSPWSEWVRKLSPRVLGHPVMAAPLKPRRVDGNVMRLPLAGHLPRTSSPAGPTRSAPQTSTTALSSPSTLCNSRLEVTITEDHHTKIN